MSTSILMYFIDVHYTSRKVYQHWLMHMCVIDPRLIPLDDTIMCPIRQSKHIHNGTAWMRHSAGIHMTRTRNSYLFVEDQRYNAPRWRISGDTLEFHRTKDGWCQGMPWLTCVDLCMSIRASLRVLNVGSLTCISVPAQKKAIMQMIHGRLEEGIRLYEGAERKVEEGGTDSRKKMVKDVEVGRSFRSLSDRNASIYTSANAPPQDGNQLIYVSNYGERSQFITRVTWNSRETDIIITTVINSRFSKRHA